jgi:hypothetical protein
LGLNNLSFNYNDINTAIKSFLSDSSTCNDLVANVLAKRIYTQINNDFDKMQDVFNVPIRGSVYQYTISSIVSNLTDFSYDKESNNGHATTVITSNVTLSNGHVTLNEVVEFIVII